MAKIADDEILLCTKLAITYRSQQGLQEKLGLKSLVTSFARNFEIHLRDHVVHNVRVEVDMLKSEAENHLSTLGTIVTESNYREILDMFHQNLQTVALVVNLLFRGKHLTTNC